MCFNEKDENPTRDPCGPPLSNPALYSESNCGLSGSSMWEALRQTSHL